MDFSRYGARRRRVLSCALLALACLGSAQADDNPGYDRPGLGFTPAVLQAGDVTWEQGLPDASRQDGSTLYNADSLLRLGLGHALELQLGSSWNWQRGGGQRLDGRGDSSLGLKFALPASGDFSWGLLGSVDFTDGAPAFRAQRRQYLVGAAFNWQLDARQALGLYLQNLRAGGQDSQLIAVNDGWELTPTLGAYVEAGWLHDADQGSGSVAGAGVSWLPTPRLQLDASTRHRLGGHASDWEAGLGVSVYFGG